MRIRNVVLCALLGGVAFAQTPVVGPSAGSTDGGAAATATRLSGTPTLCPTGQAPTGILPNGNATGCAASATVPAGPLSGPPTVTAVASNTNLLAYTGQLAAFWPSQNLTLTSGQSDESSGTSAILAVPTTTANGHMLNYDGQFLYPAADTTVTFSAYVKPSGYNYVLMTLQTQGLSTSFFDNWFNISTCAPANINGSVTAAATPAANGYCRISTTLTIPAGQFLEVLFIDPVPSSGTVGYTGDGTSGVLVSHPQLTLGASPLAYQDVTGTHRYCVAAYDSANRTQGCSTWQDSDAENNTVATSSVTGASYCEVFRSGGHTQGALSVSGSTHVACGSTVTDSGLTADGTAPPTYTQDIRGTRTSSMEAYLWQQSAGGPGFTYRLATIEPGARGTLTHVHLSVGGASSAVGLGLNVRCDGATPENGILLDLGTFMLTQGNPNPYMGKRIGIPVSKNGGGDLSINRELEIPFTNGCIVDVIANAPTNVTMYGFGEVEYKVGEYYSSPLRKHWHANTLSGAAAGYTLLNLLPTVSAAGGGELESVTLWASPSNGTMKYLEGNPHVIADGALAITANGTEDFFGSGFYFESGSLSLQSDKWGGWVGAGLQSPLTAGDSLLFRFFDLPFGSSLAVTWPVGQFGQSDGASVTYKSVVTYWTAN